MTRRTEAPWSAACVCQGSGKIAGVLCSLCRGSGDLSDIAPRADRVEVESVTLRLLGAHQRQQRIEVLHAVAADLPDMDGESRRRWATILIDDFLSLGEQGEAACIGRDHWRDLPDDVLDRAGCYAELRERARLRARYMEPVVTDEEMQIQWGEMPGGVQ